MIFSVPELKAGVTACFLYSKAKNRGKSLPENPQTSIYNKIRIFIYLFIFLILSWTCSDLLISHHFTVTLDGCFVIIHEEKWSVKLRFPQLFFLVDCVYISSVYSVAWCASPLINSQHCCVSAAHTNTFLSSSYSHSEKSMTPCSYIQETKGQSWNRRPNAWVCVTGDAEKRRNLCQQNVSRLDHGMKKFYCLFLQYFFFPLDVTSGFKMYSQRLTGSGRYTGFLTSDNQTSGIETFTIFRFVILIQS